MKNLKYEEWVAWVKLGLDLGTIKPSNIKITMRPVTEVEEETEIENLVKELVEPSKAIVLYNDDVNSFLHVINCLMLYCEHDKHQAEQCATIVHHNGKCAVKGGSYDKLKPICEALLDQKLSCKIE